MRENFYTRGDGRYFAFVEAIDPLSDEAMKHRERLPEHWPGILDRRHPDSRPPTHRVWLDCVRRDYFLDLDWVRAPYKRSMPEVDNQRRHLLLEMDVDQFATILLLLSDTDIHGGVEQIQEGSWQEIILSPSVGLPVVAAADFDLIDAQPCYITGQDAAKEHRDLLLNVFNLEFLPDADFGEYGGTPPWPGGGPPFENVGIYPDYQVL
ncbi:hypothetical protein [Dyella sp.]|uniref:hypothetical protein n=1 Tax=Dyella sp. TaxID=1869338 RepID=UPI002B4834E3|nr:hypothetical protein [Dyella sp.]HKT27594.1 hypothetical protein [Dyella sp.]